ncbi:MAG: hypothetical protein PHW31_02220 [Candidatus Pacebacteria bacterium]|nr:hypothetical protein [Candidatus Paceibacterota bacterium]
MNSKEIKEKIKSLKKLYDEEKFNEAHAESEDFVLKLFKEEKYKDIVEADKKLESVPIIFEVAYSYSEMGDEKKAEEMYETILSFPGEEKNSAILNNLSNIKKSKGKIKEAFDLIQKAKKIDAEGEIVDRNYQNLLGIINEQEAIERNYKKAVSLVQKENDFVIEKLKNFFTNIKKEVGLKNNQVAIPNWKFKVLMCTDEQKAESLKKQWIEKGYIRKTNQKIDNFVSVYEINNYIEKAIEKARNTKINKKWIEGFENIDIIKLEKIGYFEILSKICKINKKFKFILERDFNELTFNYLVGNAKSVIVMAGSLVEVLLIYHCEKKNTKKITYQIQNKAIQKDLYDCDLGDLLSYFEQGKIMSDLLVHLGNISRIYRNFIHPGKEIREFEKLDQTKSDLCYIGAVEIIKKLI